MVPVKLHDNRIFKALLRFEKSHKTIDFDLSKHKLLLPTHSKLVELLLVEQGKVK